MASGIEDGGIRLADNPELHGRYADLRRDVEPTPSTRHDVGLSFGQYDRAADRFDEFSPAFAHRPGRRLDANRLVRDVTPSSPCLNVIHFPFDRYSPPGWAGDPRDGERAPSRALIVARLARTPSLRCGELRDGHGVRPFAHVSIALRAPVHARARPAMLGGCRS